MDDKRTKIQAQLDAVRTSYIASLIGKRESIRSNWDQLKSSWMADKYDQIYLIIHGLAGSAETFGFPQITQQARTVVNYFKKLNPQTAPVSMDEIHEINQEMMKLLKLLQQPK